MVPAGGEIGVPMATDQRLCLIRFGVPDDCLQLEWNRRLCGESKGAGIGGLDTSSNSGWMGSKKKLSEAGRVTVWIT